MSEFKVKKDFPDMPQIDGVSLASIDSGISKSKKLDLMLVKGSPGSVICGLLTKSKTCSPAVKWCRKNLSLKQDNTKPIGIVANSGNANVFTGKVGEEAVHSIITAAKTGLGTKKENIFVASTGVIGERLKHKKIINQMNNLTSHLSNDSFGAAAEAIMTTDTFRKGTFREFSLDGTTIKINGIAKGSGMIEPNMATMLVFIFSNISISKVVLQKIVSECNKETFNTITVDSDTSTSDTLLCITTGRANMDRITRFTDPRVLKFKKFLQEVMMDLAYLVVSDGEGAKKFIEFKIIGAKSKKSARKIGKSIANSPLVKTAFAGEDPNWGRIVMAIGKSGEKINVSKLSIHFGEHRVAENGSLSESYSEQTVAKYMEREYLFVKIDVGTGTYEASVFTCDLTKEYVAINSDYRS